MAHRESEVRGDTVFWGRTYEKGKKIARKGDENVRHDGKEVVRQSGKKNARHDGKEGVSGIRGDRGMVQRKRIR